MKYKKKLEDRKNDPANDEYYNNQKRGQLKAKDNSEFLKMSASEKARYFRNMKKSQDDYKQQVETRLAQDEADRIAKEKASDPWSFMTDLVEEGIGAIPVVGQIVKPLVGVLRNKLEGGQVKKPKRARKPSERNNIVRKVMNERGLSMIMASKFVKDNGLY